MKYLFIGGSKDGEWITVHKGNRINFPILDKDQNKYNKDTYRKEIFLSEGNKVVLYILEGISNTEAFQRLLEGYSAYYNPTANAT